MKAPGFDSRSAHKSDVSVSSMAARLSFETGSAYESDLSSSTVQCSGSGMGCSYGSAIPFLAEIACLPFELGPAYASAISFLTETWWLSFDRDRAHEPKIPFLAEIPSDYKSAYESDVSVSNVTVCLSFDTGSVHESDLSSSTLQCYGSDPGPSYVSDIPFLAEIAVDAKHEHGFGPRTLNMLSLATETMCGCNIPRLSDTVYLSYDTRFESDLPISNEILSELKLAHGSENPSSTDTVSLSSEPEATHESDILHSTDIAFLPYEAGPAYVSVVPFLTETHHPLNVSLLPSQQDRSVLMKAPGFDSRSAHKSDVSVSSMAARLSFETGSAYESDLSSSTVQCSGSGMGCSYGSAIPFLAEIAIDTEYAHGFGLPTSNMLPLATETMCGRGIPRSTDIVR
eukprot:SAG31_NODE_5855_length_2292_cov_52.916553_2_plen_398_part_01